MLLFLAAAALADTLTILVAGDEQVRIRLSKIGTSERGQPESCKAKRALTDRVAGETINVEIGTIDRYARTAGKIWLDGRDISRELVAAGLGLWGLPEVERILLWEWRRAKRWMLVLSGRTLRAERLRELLYRRRSSEPDSI